MGRAYEVRKASIQKTGAAKAKLYSMFAREIYQVAKRGGTDASANLSLKKLIEKAKGSQVPGDIIKRAIDKVNSGDADNLEQVMYEVFGVGGSTYLIECLTDNVNRSISDVRGALNKCKSKMGVSGSVSFNYDHFGIVGFKGLSDEETLELLLEDDIDISDIETEDGLTVVYGDPKDFYAIKESIQNKIPEVDFEIDQICYIAKDKVDLGPEDKELFDRLLTLLDDAEDVQNIYHNVNQ